MAEMKKIGGLILKVFLGLFLLILILLFTIPVIFRDKIKVKVEEVINESVNATVSFDDYKLGFFRNFPDLSFSLTGVTIAGIEKFEKDTLAAFDAFSLVFNAGSLFKKSGYEVKSVVLENALINAIVLKDGSANWDIMAVDSSAVAEAETVTETSSSDLKVLLKRFDIVNSTVRYKDMSADMSAELNDVNFNLKGDMSMSETDMQMSLRIGELSFIMEGLKYLNKAIVDSKFDLLADLDGMNFTFRDNYLSINDLQLNFKGNVSMPGENIITDIEFGTDQTSFKTLLSLVPAVYMSDYQDLKTSGVFSLKGGAKGLYSDADSTLPDINIDLNVSDGVISYPELPEKITNINIKASAFVDGTEMDNTVAGIDQFHMELAGSPFDLAVSIRTPMSDPDVKGSAKGKIDLNALSKAVPMDSINMSGIINMSMSVAGKMSMIEKEQYDKFQASGNLEIQDMLVEMIGYPGVKINNAGFEFTPAYASLAGADLLIGSKSDFKINGRIENYIPYVFNNETVKGILTLRSDMVDLTDIMSEMAIDTTTVEDTTALAVIRVPDNIDFDFNAMINNLVYDNIQAKNLKGHVIVRDGILSIKETGMNIIGGNIVMNADYDTRDSLKPVMKADFRFNNMNIKDAFNTFNTVQQFAPAAKGIDGKTNMQLSFSSFLGSDMMPVISTISGGGKLQSDQVTLVESATFDKIKDLLKMGDNLSNTFRDLNLSFRIADGRIYVNPFDTRMGDIKFNLSGDQGLDQTLNYLVKTEIPRADLGGAVNSLIDNLASQAAAFGVSYKPADVIKVNLKVTGLFGKPVVTPDFGGTSGESSGTLKETVTETARQKIDNVVDTGKERARLEAEEQGNKLVAEAEERARQIREEAVAAADKIKKEADEQAQRLVEGAASKGMIAKAAAQKGADALKAEAGRKADQLVKEADNQATRLVEEANTKKEDLINKIQ